MSDATTTKITATATGRTYPHRSWLKDEGFTWDGDNWTIELEEDSEGRLHGPNFINSDRQDFAHCVSCHCKRQVTLVWEE